MILAKPTVRLVILSRELLYIFNTIVDLNELLIPDYPIDWVITSINDSTHAVGSKHYENKAIDLRSKNFKGNTIKMQFKERLQFALGDNYTVLLENIGLENEHFHIQVKKGLS